MPSHSAHTDGRQVGRLIQNDLSADLPRVDRAEGVWVWDTDGRRYLDACSGAVVAAIGHAHPHVLAAMRRQAARATFVHRGHFSSESLAALAARIGQLTGYAGVWFVNSGSEAVEAAMQFAVQYHRELGRPERHWFLSFTHGYHGNSLGGLSLSGHARRVSMAQLVHPFNKLPVPYGFRDAGSRNDRDYACALLADARQSFERHADHLAGIVVEPVGGATLGATVPPDSYLAGLKALCEEFGCLFIADEVMTGFGRTGRVMACEHWGVEPDLAATGKGLGAGYTPIAAALVSDRVLSTIRDGSGRLHGGHTYAGNPLSAATALAVLDVVQNERLVERAALTGAGLRAGLGALSATHPIIADVRGLGMLLAIELIDDKNTEPSGHLARRCAATARDHGLLLYPTTGGFNDALLIAPPLTISQAETAHLLAQLAATLNS